jgi:hypothetical protein
MTEKEAIEYLKGRYLVVESPLNPTKEECESHNAVIDMAIEALRKQMPIKPVTVLGADRRLIRVLRMTIDEKINRLRAAEKRLRKHLSEDEFGVVGRTAEGFGQEADWLEELKRYRDLEEQGRLLVLPCKVGDTVYEILEETVPNHYFYISEHKVQDVSVKAVKYADEWASYDYENLYFTREEAKVALEKRRNGE